MAYCDTVLKNTAYFQIAYAHRADQKGWLGEKVAGKFGSKEQIDECVVDWFITICLPFC